MRVSDAKDLEAAILEVLSDPELWNQMSQSAIKRAEKYYDEKIMIAKYQQIYESTMNKG